MNEYEVIGRRRELSISSERTLDNLEVLPSAVTSPVTSPGSGSRREQMDRRLILDPGVARPPHHSSAYPDDVDGRTSQFSFDYGEESPGHSRQQQKLPPMPRVQMGSHNSPVRKLKRKDESEREGSDYYELRRHNTSDINYSTTENRSGILKKRSDLSVERDSKNDTYPMDSENLKKRRKKKGKKKGVDSMAGRTSVRRGVSNEAYQGEGQSVAGNGISEVNERQKGVISRSLVSLTAPIVKKPYKVKADMSGEKQKTLEEMDEENLAKFVQRSRIKQRECSVYLRDKSNDGYCLCGRPVDWHEIKGLTIRSEAELQDKHEIWHLKTHTETFPTDSFGVIQFQGFGQETQSSPYIRLCPATDLETVWSLMTEQWKLPIPKLIISVTGGAQRFELNSRLKAVFKRGLINVATTTGAWIVTGGTGTGVMQFVGEAVRDHLLASGSNNSSVVAIGIASWGIVANREALDGEGNTGLFPASYSFEDLSDARPKDVPLDHNHTHFVLVDDGKEGKFGGEIEFRSMLERYISEKVETGVAQCQSVNVPTVMLVVEGGVNTMTTVWQALQVNIPVLVLEGSSRAADFIAFGYELSRDPFNEDNTKFPDDFDEIMKNVARTKFAWKKKDDMERKIHELLRELKDVLRSRRLVNIYKMSEADTKDMDRAVLYALFKANKTNANAQLSLALAWNRCDIARDEIFTPDNRQYWKNINLYDAMFTALVQDRVDFVQLFLENGVCLKKFLSIETLWNLYGNTLSDMTDRMSQLLNNLMLYLRPGSKLGMFNIGLQSWGAYLCCRPVATATHQPDLLSVIGKVLVHLLGDENINPYTGNSFILTKMKKPVLQWLPGNHKKYETNQSDQHTLHTRPSVDSGRYFHKRKQRDYDFKRCPERELFYWAILMNRKELGKMFWRAGTDQLGAALVASSLLKALAHVADDDEELELSLDLMEHSNMYEDMAVGVLSECYKKDKQMAHMLLVRRQINFGLTTLFSLADSHTLMKFMGHTSCQTKLNLIWKGRMALYTQTWKICLCLLFPVCIPAAIKFSSNEGSMEDEEDEFDDIEEEGNESRKEEIHVISNKVMPNMKDDNKIEEELFVRAQSRREKPQKKKLYRVQMFNDMRTNSIGLCSAIYFFYTAPVSVFIVNIVSYLVYLGLFTFFVLTDLYPESQSVYEYLIWGWTITMVIEEMRQIVASDRKSLVYKVRNWFNSMWNRFDLSMYTIFILSVFLRFYLTGEKFLYARIFYSITLSMYYLRFMQFFFVEKNIGPKVIMIRNMLIDLMFFLGIFLVFMLSFGVIYQANLFPNSPPSLYLFKSVLYIPYWQMYGELFLENMEGEAPDNCTKNETIWRADGGKNRCPEQNSLVSIVAAAYLLLTNVLLVNLLIAMFSYTFQMVQDKSEQVWRFYRFSLVYEFYDRPMLCPPLIIISHAYRSFLFISRRTCSQRKYKNEFKLNLDDKDNNRLTVFVRTAMENYLNISQQASREELSNKVSSTANRIEKVIEELERIKETVNTPKLSPGDTTMDQTNQLLLSARKSPHPTPGVEILQERLEELSNQVASNSAQMLQMMHAIQTLARQQSRPSQLEIRDMTHDAESLNDSI